METKWNKGPLEARYDDFYSCWVVAPAGKPDDGGSWAETARCDLDEDEDEANARLYAAAPDLYEALKYMSDLFKYLGGTQTTDTGWKTDEMLAVYERAVTALAKASDGGA